MHFSDAITEYSFDCKVRKLSVKTISNYQKQLRYLQRYLEEEFKIKEVEEVRSFHIKQFLSMMDDKERKARYINDLLKVFKTFFNYLKKEGHIKERPTANVKNMKQPKVKIITFTEAEIRKLLNHFSGRTFLSIRNRAILAGGASRLYLFTIRYNKVLILNKKELFSQMSKVPVLVHPVYYNTITRLRELWL